jgi:hypothetical protein
MLDARQMEKLPITQVKDILATYTQNEFDELYCEIIDCGIERPIAVKIVKEEDNRRESQ